MSKTRDLVYQVIVDYISKNGYAPSFREIGELSGLKSTSSVHAHIHRLAEEGRIEIGENEESRRIKVIGYKFVKESEDLK